MERASARAQPVANGGFPEPLAGEPVREVRCTHAACGAETVVRLPEVLPESVVRRAVCVACGAVYEPAEALASAAREEPAPAEVSRATPTEQAAMEDDAGEETTEAASAEPARRPRRLPRLPSLPPASNPVWRWAGIPVAALLVLGGLFLVLGDGGPKDPSDREAAGTAGSGPSSSTEFVNEPGYSLALPPGWEATEPEGGAVFAAAASDGGATATLWIEVAPTLTFEDFEERSLADLRELTGNAEVAERIKAPTDEGRVVTLRADAPEGTGVSSPYVVTLRAAGPYRYYLATTVEPGASVAASEGADVLQTSFIPKQAGPGEVETGAAPGG